MASGGKVSMEHSQFGVSSFDRLNNWSYPRPNMSSQNGASNGVHRAPDTSDDDFASELFAQRPASFHGRSAAATLSEAALKKSRARLNFSAMEMTRSAVERNNEKTTATPGAIPPLDLSRLMQRRRRRRLQQRATGGSELSDATSVASSQRSEVQQGPFRPGLSAQISGTAFMNYSGANSTATSAVSSHRDADSTRQSSKEDSRVSSRMAAVMEEVNAMAARNATLFDSLRETIYSEVASLISQNESRPHFLIELFRELQMLNSDYLRQRPLYSIQDLVNRYLNPSDDAAARLDLDDAAHLPQWLHPGGLENTTSEHTPSESMVPSEDESNQPQRRAGEKERIQRYDYVEPVDSASTLSTPSTREDSNSWAGDADGSIPFASDSLGDTAIHLDQAMRRVREFERLREEAHAQLGDSHPDVSTDAGSSSARDQDTESVTSDGQYPKIDLQELDIEIKAIMSDVIPVLKDHCEEICSPALLDYLRRLIISLTKKSTPPSPKGEEFGLFFYKQLANILRDTLNRFCGRRMRECGEDMLIGISEVLFNELAFFRLMQHVNQSSSVPPQRKLSLTLSVETTTNTEQSTYGSETEGDGRDVDVDEDDGEGEEEEEDDEEAEKGVIEMELESQSSGSAMEEEEDLGKERDDELASYFQGDEEMTPVKIALAMSETKPWTRIGSDEDGDDEDASENGYALQPETAVSVSRERGADDLTTDEGMLESKLTEEFSSPSYDYSPNSSNNAALMANSSTETVVANQYVFVNQSDVLADGDSDQDGTTTAIDEEITVEDLPASLDALDPVQLQNRMNQEQEAISALHAALDMVNLEADLAGDPARLEPPESNA